MPYQPTKHLWEHDHPHHASPIAARFSYPEYTNYVDHDSWADFIVAWGNRGPDRNLVFRWDWNRDLDDDGPRNELNLFMVRQCRGDYWSHTITVTDTDEAAIREWLTDRARAISALWEPILPMRKLEEAEEPLRPEANPGHEMDRLVSPIANATIRDGVLVCPQCGGRDSVVELDSATRENRVSVLSDDVLSVHLEDAHFERDRFQCTECGHEVALLPFEVCYP
ncbi:hypothetical protein AB0C84_42860 [Actinomadura sp. NPDC048955]|uniref:hypothetical protein n=1 Tax=Actinomadura sp. NPDC048955 TaxID=3158228 RepID=UPI0033F1BEDC